MVYAHANGKTLDDTVAAVAHQKLGLQGDSRAVRHPGIEHAYGIAKGDAPYEPAEKGPPLETVWSTEPTWPSCRRCSSGCARSSAPTCTCCTTCTTG